MQFSRFVSMVHTQYPNKLVLRDQGFAKLSAKVIARIIGGSQLFTTIDLCMNNLGQGLDDLVDGLKQNDRIVCLRLRNNNIDGRRFQEVFSSLLQDHPSLTSVDLGNSENIKNRNRIYDEGFIGMIEGIIKSETSLISELHF